MQGNSILALSGLAYKISLIDSDGIKRHSEGAPVDSVQFVNNKEWLLRVADTVMVVFNGNFRPKSEPMRWCQQVNSFHTRSKNHVYLLAITTHNT